MKPPFASWALLVLAVAGAACHSDDNPAAPTPADGLPFLASVTPPQARPLTDIWLSGRNLLSAGLGTPTVRFTFGRFRVDTMPSEASNTDLRVAVPDIVGSGSVTVVRDGLTSNSIPVTAVSLQFFDGNYAGTATGPNGAVTIEFNISGTNGLQNPCCPATNFVHVWSGAVFDRETTTACAAPAPLDLVNRAESNYTCFDTTGGFGVGAQGCFVSPTQVVGTFTGKDLGESPHCLESYAWTAVPLDQLQINP